MHKVYYGLQYSICVGDLYELVSTGFSVQHQVAVSFYSNEILHYVDDDLELERYYIKKQQENRKKNV